MKQDFGQIWAEHAEETQLWLALDLPQKENIEHCGLNVVPRKCWNQLNGFSNSFFIISTRARPHRDWLLEEPSSKSGLTFSTLAWQKIISGEATPQWPWHLSLRSFQSPHFGSNFSRLSCHAANLHHCKPSSLNSLKSKLQFSWFKSPIESPELVKGCGPCGFKLAPLRDGLRW